MSTQVVQASWSSDSSLRQEIVRKQVTKFLRGNSPASTREVRGAVPARAALVDRALRALLSESKVIRTDSGWVGLRSDGTRWGHETPRVRASGRQVSYRKAVDVAVEMLIAAGHPREEKTRVLAEQWMRDALPEKQRARTRITDG